MAPSAIAQAPVAPGVTTIPHDSPMRENAVSADFDVAKHLNYSPPAKILTMKDLGLEPTELSPIATTEPFPLLSHEGVLQHRRDIFNQDVLDNCVHKTRPGSVQIRGMAPRYSRFIKQFWNSPEVLKIVSDNAGVELVPALDYETCHVNVQGGLDEVRSTPVEPPAATEEAIQRLAAQNAPEGPDGYNEKKAIIEWHKDSHPWVCVVMLSDARYMTGGETILQKGDGSSLPVIAPQMVSALILCRLLPYLQTFIVTNERFRATLFYCKVAISCILPLQSPICPNA